MISEMSFGIVSVAVLGHKDSNTLILKIAGTWAALRFKVPGGNEWTSVLHHFTPCRVRLQSSVFGDSADALKVEPEGFDSS